MLSTPPELVSRGMLDVIAKRSSLFPNFEGPALEKSQWVFTFVMLILYAVLYIPSVIVWWRMRSRESPGFGMLQFSVLFFIASEAIDFKSDLLDTVIDSDNDRTETLSAVSSMLYIVAKALLFCSLFFMASSQFDRTRSRIPRLRLPVITTCVVFVMTQLIYVITFSNYTIKEFNRLATPNDIRPPPISELRASLAFAILNSLIEVGLAFWLAVWTNRRREGVTRTRLVAFIRLIIGPMLICAAIIRLIDTCAIVWFDTHIPKTVRDSQHRELVELQISLGDSIAQDLTDFISISLAIIGGLMMRNAERDEKFTSIS